MLSHMFLRKRRCIIAFKTIYIAFALKSQRCLALLSDYYILAFALLESLICSLKKLKKIVLLQLINFVSRFLVIYAIFKIFYFLFWFKM